MCFPLIQTEAKKFKKKRAFLCCRASSIGSFYDTTTTSTKIIACAQKNDKFIKTTILAKSYKFAPIRGCFLNKLNGPLPIISNLI